MLQNYCYMGKPHCGSTERCKEAVLYGLFESVYTVTRFPFYGFNKLSKSLTNATPCGHNCGILLQVLDARITLLFRR